jgi:hypothetical protein
MPCNIESFELRLTILFLGTWDFGFEWSGRQSCAGAISSLKGRVRHVLVITSIGRGKWRPEQPDRVGFRWQPRALIPWHMQVFGFMTVDFVKETSTQDNELVGSVTVRSKGQFYIKNDGDSDGQFFSQQHEAAPKGRRLPLLAQGAA